MSLGEEVHMQGVEYSRRFYVLWFMLFTVISMALNGMHAFIAAPRAWSALDASITSWLAVGAGMPTWFAVTAVLVSQIPPVALACATNALVKPDPTTTSGRGSAARTTTWTIAGGAFVLSAIAMTDLTHMLLGVPLAVAAIMPIIVDVSIVAAVLRLEIRREGHRAEAHLPDESPQVGDASPTHDVAMNRPVEQPVAPHEPPVTRTMGQSTAHREAPLKRPVERTVGQPAPLSLTHDAAVMAQRIAEQTTISQPVEVITEVLELASQAGMSQRKIAEAASADGGRVSPSTVGRIITAAKTLDAEAQEEREPALSAVG